MNKVISINIAGSIFQIEENAYEVLNTYLISIKNYFAGKTGGNEIITDIEGRIAELFQEKLHPGKAAINSEDVNSVVSSMGQPEDFADDEEQSEPLTQEATNKNAPVFNTTTKRKRIFRDTDDRILGGVCTGLGHYFNVDPIWIRLAFVAILFLKGAAIPIYILLWIIIPEARTTADKLEMKGERIDINNIERSIKDELNRVKSNLESNNFIDKVKIFLNRVVDLIIILFKNIFRIIRALLAVVLALAGITVFVALVSLFTGSFIVDNTPLSTEYLGFFFYSKTQQSIFIAGLIVFITGAVLSILFGAYRLFSSNMSNERRRLYRPWRMSLGVLTFAGLVTVVLTSFSVAKDFSSRNTINKTIASDSLKNDIYITLREQDPFPNFEKDFELTEQGLLLGNVSLDIIRSNDETFSMTEQKTSRGNTIQNARYNAELLETEYMVNDSTITLPQTTLLKNHTLYRGQHVSYILKVPVGRRIHLSPYAADILNNTEFVSDEFVYDAGNKTLEMTAHGLKCVDCGDKDVSILSSGYNKNYTLSDFNAIEISGAASVTVVKGSYSVRALDNSALNDYEVERNGNTLKIRSKHHFGLLNFKTKEIKLFISAPDLNRIEMRGAGHSNISGFENELELELSGAMSCNLNANLSKLDITMNGASSAHLKGSCNDMQADLNGASNLDAEDFKTMNAKIEANGACYADVNVTGVLTTEANGASKIKNTK